jgi:hypothetical protein
MNIYTKTRVADLPKTRHPGTPGIYYSKNDRHEILCDVTTISDVTEAIVDSNEKLVSIKAKLSNALNNFTSVRGCGMLSRDVPVCLDTATWDNSDELRLVNLSGLKVNDVTHAKWLLDKVNAFSHINEDFLNSLDNGLPPVDSFFILFSDRTTYYAQMCFRKYTIVDGINCNKCSAPVLIQDLEVHQRTWDCGIEEGKALAAAHNMKHISDPNIALSVRCAIGVDSLLIPTRFDVMAPTWVHEAIGMYNANDHFAGMTLSEFLVKLAAEKKT